MSPEDPKGVEQRDSARTQSAGDQPARTSSVNRTTLIVALLGILATIAAAIVSPLLSRSNEPIIVGAPIDKTVVVVQTVIVERTVVVTSAPSP